MFDKYGRGVLSWSELSGVMKALGFPEISSVIVARAKIDITPANSNGLDSKELQKLLHSDEMQKALDYTFNKHNSTYNIRVIKKVLSILVSGMLTLDDIRDARMSFMLYEGELCSGIPLDERSIICALKVTGKMIAPKKLQEWMKQLNPDVPGKVQLYEFFDLIKICDNKDEMKRQIPTQPTTIEKGDRGLYTLADSNFLLTPDQKLLKKMDEEYENILSLLQTQQSVPKEKHARILDKNNQGEKARAGSKAEAAIESYYHIRDAIAESNGQVRKARAMKRPTTLVNATSGAELAKKLASVTVKESGSTPTTTSIGITDMRTKPELLPQLDDAYAALKLPSPRSDALKGNLFAEAKERGIPRRTVYNKIERFISDPQFAQHLEHKPRKRQAANPRAPEIKLPFTTT